MKINKHIIHEKILEENLKEAFKLLSILTYKCGNELHEKAFKLSSKLSALEEPYSRKEINALMFDAHSLQSEVSKHWEIEDWDFDDLANKKNKILFLASNPKNSVPLRLGEEIAKIEKGLGRSKNRDSFQLIQKWAVQTTDLRRALLDENPDYIHFSGHGTKDGEIMLEDIQGQSKNAAAQAIGKLFYLFRDKIKCVILNSCYSNIQAEEIVKHIPFVIGMKNEIPDVAAIAFSEAFYDGIANGRNIEFSFELAKTSLDLDNLDAENIPVLLKKDQSK